MTAKEISSKTAKAAHDALEGWTGSVLKACTVFGIGGLAMYILLVVVTKTGPETVQALNASHESQIKTLRESQETVVSRLLQSHEKVVAEQSQTFQDSIKSLAGEMIATREIIANKLEEGNSNTKAFNQQLLQILLANKQVDTSEHEKETSQ